MLRCLQTNGFHALKMLCWEYQFVVLTFTLRFLSFIHPILLRVHCTPQESSFRLCKLWVESYNPSCSTQVQSRALMSSTTFFAVFRVKSKPHSILLTAVCEGFVLLPQTLSETNPKVFDYNYFFSTNYSGLYQYNEDDFSIRI